MARLPQPGGDSGNWGDILNDYLSQSHKTDGSLKDNSVTGATIAPGAVTKADVGLSDVNNTADTVKPISTAQQSAFDLKANTSALATKLNTADLDTQTAAKINDGASATAGALTASIADAVPALAAVARSSGSLVNERFPLDAAGSPVKSQTGLDWILYAETPQAELVNEGGVLRYANRTGGYGGYITVASDNPITFMRLSAKLTSWAVEGGEVVLAATTLPIGAAGDLFAAHLRIGVRQWSLDVQGEGDVSRVTLMNGDHGYDLATYDATVSAGNPGVADKPTFEAMLWLNQATATCTILLPNGQIITSTDARHAQGARYAFAEVYRTVATGDANVRKYSEGLIEEFQVRDTEDGISSVVRRLSRSDWSTGPIRAVGLTADQSMANTSNVPVLLGQTGTPTAPALRIIARVPELSHALDIEVNLPINVTDATNVSQINVCLLSDDGADTLVAYSGIGTIVGSRTASTVIKWSPTTEKPGSIVSFRVGVQKISSTGSAGTVYVLASNSERAWVRVHTVEA